MRLRPGARRAYTPARARAGHGRERPRIVTAPQPRALLLDIEGVVAHPDVAALDAALAALRPGLDAAALEAARNRPDTYPAWRAYSVGALSSDAYWTAIARALGLEPDPAAARLAAAMRGAWWARLDEAVLEIVAAVRRQRAGDDPRLGILSNSAPEHEAHIPRFADLFDAACFSHRIGARKPDEPAYRAALAALGVPAADVVFVDDKARNTDAAAALGMIGVPFAGAEALRDLVKRLGWLDE